MRYACMCKVRSIDLRDWAAKLEDMAVNVREKLLDENEGLRGKLVVFVDVDSERFDSSDEIHSELLKEVERKDKNENPYKVFVDSKGFSIIDYDVYAAVFDVESGSVNIQFFYDPVKDKYMACGKVLDKEVVKEIGKDWGSKEDALNKVLSLI